MRGRGCSIISFIVAIGLISGQASAQYWAKDFGGTGGDRISDVKVGADGYVYSVGEFSAAMTVDGNTYSSSGGTDVFVVKMDDAGNVVWLVQAGGFAIDRAGKVALDDAGHVVVTGQFMATADLFGTTLTSAGNTFDFFVAKLNTSDGSAQWVRTGGGDVHADKANGVTVAPNGTVAVVGEFRGTATFDGGMLTSMPDPFTLLPSIDVFVAGYSSAGAPLWLKHGQAEFTDRAVDVVADAANNFYVGGQFSDTIQFDQVHQNAMYNSIFLLKLDANGNEQWFRRCGGGAFNHVRDMQMTSTNQLLVAGDQQGAMLYVDAVPQIIPADDAYNYFLLRVGLNGQLLSDTTIGSQNPITLRSVDQRADTLAVFGEFECQFTGLSQFYNGTGLFMATGPQDLFIAKHRFSNWNMLQAQQFGGQEDKRAGAIASLADGDLVFGGGYEQNMFIPADTSYWGDYAWWAWCAHFTVNIFDLEAYCNDSSYTNYSSLVAVGLSDAFLSKAFVRSRTPYDLWRRHDSIPCDRSEVDVCVRPLWNSNGGCPDTLIVCEHIALTVLAPQGYSWEYAPFSSHEDLNCFPEGQIGYSVVHMWSDGSAGWDLDVYTTGWYWCTVSTSNGCWSWTDSIYVVVNANPPIPTVSDELGQNTNVGGWVNVYICDTTWVWNTNPLGNYSAYWEIPGTVLNDSVALIDNALLHFLSPEGCFSTTVLNIHYDPVFDIPALDSVSFEWFIYNYPDSITTDTVAVCFGECAAGGLIPTWYQNGVPIVLDSIVEAEWSTGCDGSFGPPWVVPIGWSVAPTVSGWYQFSTIGSLNNFPCGFDFFPFSYVDSVYVIVVPEPDPVIVGPMFMCPSDTIELAVLCTQCDSLQWLLWSYDTLAVNSTTALVPQPGYVVVNAWNVGPGKLCHNWDDHIVALAPGPSLDISPAFICPGDSALLWTTTPGSNYEWLGPNGPISFSNDSVFITDFGDYFLTIIDTSGCEVTNGPIELGAFSSPYLDVQPDYVLCPGDSVTLTVVTNDTASIVWGAPLSGSATSQTITQAGLYTCTVGSCTPQTLTAYIIGGSPNATILPNDTIALCLGDSMQLSGANGEAVYLWDSFQFQQSMWVGAVGTHQLVVFDEVSCTDTAFAVVTVGIPGDPVVVVGDTVCQGGTAQLTATGSGQIVWFADAALTDTVSIGNSFSLANAQQSTTYYVLQVDAICTALPVAVQLVVLPNPTDQYVSGPAQVCVGESLVLDMVGGPFTVVVWQTPNGSINGDPLVVMPVDLSDAGTYIATPFAEPCSWGTYTWVVQVTEPQPLYIGPDTALCVGLPVGLELPQGFSAGQWSNGTAGSSTVFTAPAMCVVSAMDAGGCVVQDTLVIEGFVCLVEVPNVFSPNGDGSNDGWQVTADGFVSAHAAIHNRWGQELYAGDPRIQPWRGRHQYTNEEVPDGVYYFVLTLQRGDGSELARTGYIHLTR